MPHFILSVQSVGLNDPVPDKGTRVDAIQYYTRELAESNKDVFVKQRRQIQVAETGNTSVRADDWLSRITEFAQGAAITILEDSVVNNDLRSPRDSSYDAISADEAEIPQAERMTSMYGSIAPVKPESTKRTDMARASKLTSLGEIPTFSHDTDMSWPNVGSVDSDDKSYPLLTQEEMVSFVSYAYLFDHFSTRPAYCPLLSLH
jgi:hypothetical protein